MAGKTPSRKPAAAARKELRDRFLLERSLNLLPPEKQRGNRAVLQAWMAVELYEAMRLCAEKHLNAPTVPLFRSLIDTVALGIWIVSYATGNAFAESVAHITTTEIVEKHFGPVDAAHEDAIAFAFLREKIRNSEHQIYADFLHPSTHGDAVHLSMRFRDEKQTDLWLRKCMAYSSQIYFRFLTHLVSSGEVEQHWRIYFDHERSQIGAELKSRWEALHFPKRGHTSASSQATGDQR